MVSSDFYDKNYYEHGQTTGKSLYTNYRWLPELTIPLAHHLANAMHLIPGHSRVLDFGCAKGYVVKALRLLGYDADGTDISPYALSQADPTIRKYVKRWDPNWQEKSPAFKDYDWVLAKDVLEHISYKEIKPLVKMFGQIADGVLIVVPLGDGVKYNVPEYELDKSHIIRQPLEWWIMLVEACGFTVEKATTDLGPLKANWNNHSEANGLIVATRGTAKTKYTERARVTLLKAVRQLYRERPEIFNTKYCTSTIVSALNSIQLGQLNVMMAQHFVDSASFTPGMSFATREGVVWFAMSDIKL